MARWILINYSMVQRIKGGGRGHEGKLPSESDRLHVAIHLHLINRIQFPQ